MSLVLDRVELGKHVVDKGLLDRDGRRAGKVDDLLLEIPSPTSDGSLPRPEVVAIVCGPLALSQTLPRPFYWLARRVYALFGLPSARPIAIPWSRVTRIDVVVHVDVERDLVGLTALAQAVDERFISRLPGA